MFDSFHQLIDWLVIFTVLRFTQEKIGKKWQLFTLDVPEIWAPIGISNSRSVEFYWLFDVAFFRLLFPFFPGKSAGARSETARQLDSVRRQSLLFHDGGPNLSFILQERRRETCHYGPGSIQSDAVRFLLCRVSLEFVSKVDWLID